jgi:CRISPR system Cascade subunit CasA
VSRAWIAAGLAATLAGCVHYAPAPLHPERFPAELDARRLAPRPAGDAWNGADLLTAALERNPQVMEARAKYATALAAARTAKLAPPLTLTLTAEYANETPRWGYGGAADIALDAGVRRSARMSTADLQALQAWYDVAEATWAVRTALAKARIELDASDAETALAVEVAKLRRERLQRLERRVASGEDDRALALSAQAELAASERRVADALGRRALALAALAKALGVGPAAVRDLTLAPVADRPALDGLPTWRRDAALQRTDVLRAVVDYDLAETALTLEVAKQYPEVRLSPGYTYDHGVTKLPFGLSLALPTYDLNRRAIDQAELARAASGRSLELAQANALAAVDTAGAAVQAARAAEARLSARDLPAARRAADNTARALAAGAADRVDDLGAHAAVLDAELNLLDAQRAARTAAADLEEALRRPFDAGEAAVLRTALTEPGAAR